MKKYLILLKIYLKSQEVFLQWLKNLFDKKPGTATHRGPRIVFDTVSVN